METIAVFVDDAEHARHLLRPLMQAESEAARWVLVACAPKLTRRIGKWTSHASREHWRAKWVEQLFGDLRPLFAGVAPGLETLTADGPLPQVAAALRTRFGTTTRVLDARRPKLAVVPESLVAEGVEPQQRASWGVPIAVSSGLSVVLALSD